jgi:hypothetical protein
MEVCYTLRLDYPAVPLEKRPPFLVCLLADEFVVVALFIISFLEYF